MRVILRQDVAGLGRKGDVKEVTDGYAQNKLLPQQLVDRATDARVAQIEREAQARAAELAQQKEAIESAVNALKGESVTVSAKANEKGHLFEAVRPDVLARAISERLGHSITADMLRVDSAIKEVGGGHTVRVVLGDTEAEVPVAVEAAQ